MISLVRNLFVENILKKGLRGNQLVQLRCISKSYYVNNIEHFLKNKSPEELSDSKSHKTTRNLSKVVYYGSGSTLGPNAKSQEFLSHFPDIMQELRTNAEKYDSFGIGKHLDRVLQYNVQVGAKILGITTLQAYELMAPKSALTKSNMKLAAYLGWCIEFIPAFMIMQDDILDESLTRKGKPCWYKVEDIGLSSINDSMLVEAGIYQILKDHFSHLNCYVKLLELFHEMIYLTSIGQYLDTRARYEDVLTFTMERYNSMSAKKALVGTFYFPIITAMHLAGFTDQEALQKAKSLLIEMSVFSQIHDDFLDCFGDPEIRDTVGTDIQSNKCSWLAVKCIERANEAQKAIMKENYGKNDEESVQRVKELYEELSLPEVYENFEEETLNTLTTKIQQTSLKFPVELYTQYLVKLNKRELQREKERV